MVVIVAIFSALVNKDAFDDSEEGERRNRLLVTFLSNSQTNFRLKC